VLWRKRGSQSEFDFGKIAMTMESAEESPSLELVRAFYDRVGNAGDTFAADEL